MGLSTSELVAGYTNSSVSLKVTYLITNLRDVDEITRLPIIATGNIVSLCVDGTAKVGGFLRSHTYYPQLPESAEYNRNTGLFSFPLNEDASRKLAENLKKARIGDGDHSIPQTADELDSIVQRFVERLA